MNGQLHGMRRPCQCRESSPRSRPRSIRRLRTAHLIPIALGVSNLPYRGGNKSPTPPPPTQSSKLNSALTPAATSHRSPSLSIALPLP